MMRRLEEAKYQYELEELKALGMELETRLERVERVSKKEGSDVFSPRHTKTSEEFYSQL